ncbi:MAG: DNA polymerase Y family protein [Acidimicrobiales bacterium]
MRGVTRTLVAWFPDWPVTAAGFSSADLVVVLLNGQVIACSQGARERGVSTGMRRRVAESCCADLIVMKRNEPQEARMFYPVVEAVAKIAPELEVTRPGVLSLATHGPARYFGGECALRTKVVEVSRSALGSCTNGASGVLVGIADGAFSAVLAARRGVLVPERESARFLAEFPVSVLGQPELADLLVRLGVQTLGAFAALDESSVAGRFGPCGALAHRLARGLDKRPLCPNSPSVELEAVTILDPPADRLDMVAFAGRRLGAQLCGQLAAHGLECTLLTIGAETAHGESLSRNWRVSDVFDSVAIAERLRWQLEGWLAGTTAQPTPSAGIVRVSIRASEAQPVGSRQPGLWGLPATDLRAMQGIDRVAGMLGPQAVLTGSLAGGRGPHERVILLAHGEKPTAVASAPWPGRHPAPAPALVHVPVRCAEVIDGDGCPVGVDARGALNTAPSRISTERGPFRDLIGWAGPWLFDERWWDPACGRRRARFQLATDGAAYLCFIERGTWWVEATYD